MESGSVGVTRVVSSGSSSALSEGSTVARPAALVRGPKRICNAMNSSRPWRPGLIYTVVPGKLSFVVHTSLEHTQEMITTFPNRFFFSSSYHETYEPFCLDFGPVNLGVVYSFCLFVRDHQRCPTLMDTELVYYSEIEVEKRTNAAFLLAAYVMLEYQKTPEQAWEPFKRITGDAFATFRDASWLKQEYNLTVLHCLQGLSKAVKCGFYDPKKFLWSEYDFLQDPRNADLHMVTPGMCAFKVGCPLS